MGSLLPFGIVDGSPEGKEASDFPFAVSGDLGFPLPDRPKGKTARQALTFVETPEWIELDPIPFSVSSADGPWKQRP